jgi:hypothetical protein
MCNIINRKTLKECGNLAFFIYEWRRQDIPMQNRMIDWLLLDAFYKSHRQKPIIDDTTALHHPVEAEIVRCIASGITLDEFIVDWIYSNPESSVKMLRRRWFKIARLLQIYQQYSNPTLQIKGYSK